MGNLRFTVPAELEIDPRVWETAYITGIEGIPWHCQSSKEGDQFNIGRQIDESGKLNIVWPTKRFGNVCLSTTSLRISENPYSLVVELARGMVSRLKTQTAEWQRVGLRLPDTFYPLAEDALSQLLHALTCSAENQLRHAQNAIDFAVEAAVSLSSTFSLQALEARRQGEGRLSTLLGIQIAKEFEMNKHPDAVGAAFNLVCVSADYGFVESATGKAVYEPFDRQVEWTTESNKKLCIGPLINFRPGGLPQWMSLLGHGFEKMLQACCEYAQSAVERYRGKAHIWNCAAGLNVANEFRWTDEETLRMAVSLIETVRRADERSPVLLTIDQPWSEYLRQDINGISPLHFADALIRADLGLSGLALDLTMDRWPQGSFPREPTEYSRLIDRWSMLGLPLMVILSSPTDLNTAQQSKDSLVTQWGMSSEHAGLVQPERIVRLLLSKPSVHAVIWNNATSGENDCRQLWNSQGKPKPLLMDFVKLRRTYLH